MDKVQYATICAIFGDETLSPDEQVTKVNEILGINIADKEDAIALKEKVIGYGAVTIDRKEDSVTVDFDGVESTAPNFALAFMATLLIVIQQKALDKFLPDQQQDKTKDSGKRDGLGSPDRKIALPLRHKGNY